MLTHIRHPPLRMVMRPRQGLEFSWRPGQPTTMQSGAEGGEKLFGGYQNQRNRNVIEYQPQQRIPFVVLIPSRTSSIGLAFGVWVTSRAGCQRQGLGLGPLGLFLACRARTIPPPPPTPRAKVVLSVGLLSVMKALLGKLLPCGRTVDSLQAVV